MAKFGPSAKPNKFYVIRKVLIIAIKNVLFIEFEPLCQKLWTFMSDFGLFYHDHSPNMVMSCDSSCKFRKFQLFPKFALNFRKGRRISCVRVHYFDSYQQKPQRRWKTPPPSAFRISTQKIGKRDQFIFSA